LTLNHCHTGTLGLAVARALFLFLPEESGSGCLLLIGWQAKLVAAVGRTTTGLLWLSPPLATRGGITLSDPEKAEALSHSLDSQFQPVNDTSQPAVIEKVDEALQSSLS
jgi:hypothetical protein